MPLAATSRSALALTMSFGFLVVCEGHAQPYPAKSIRLVVPFSAGGPTDAIARAVAQSLSEAVGQQVVVDNRAGANAIIGTELAAKAPPDGYTLLMVAFPHAINPGLHARLPYDSVKDFAPITLAASGPMLLTAHPSVPVTDVKSLLRLARARPGELTCASSGSGSTAHMALALLNHTAGVQVLHVPYRGAGQALADLLGGHVATYFGGVVALLPHVRSGKLKGLAVSTAARSVAAPTIPTIAESGMPGYDVSGWYGLVAPAGTAREIVTRLNTEIVRQLRSRDVRERLEANGAEIVASTPQAFAAYVDAEIVKWARVIKAANIRAN